MVSKKVKRKISGSLTCVGVLCIIARVWDVISDPHSARCWFQLCGIVLLTYLCLDNYLGYRRQVSGKKKSVTND